MSVSSQDNPNGSQHKQLILLPIDSSVHSKYAFKFYLETLHHPDNKILLFHSTEPPYMGTGLGVAGYGFATGSQYEQMMQQRRQEVKNLREHYISQLTTENSEFRAVEFGPPGEAIVKAAELERVDMIVMGCRGLGKLRRTILGSVSDYVLTHVHCPVLLCHDPKYERPIHHRHRQHSQEEQHHQKLDLDLDSKKMD